MKGLSQLINQRNWMNDVSMKLLAGPLLILMILGMMILPLPPFALDLLFTFNIALSIMVLLVSMFAEKPLDFAAFPAVLLFTTLLRLSLNVASTRGADRSPSRTPSKVPDPSSSNGSVGEPAAVITAVINR